MTTVNREVACEQCELFGMCRTVGLGWGDDAQLERMVSRRFRVAKDEPLYEAGAACDTIFAVKSGTFKSVVKMADGHEQIVDFHYPGELIGVEGIDSGRYGFAVSALTPASVCRMRIVDLPLGNAARMRFDQRLVEALSRTVRQCHGSFLLIGAQSAEHTLAAFLIGISDRFRARGLPAYRFRLPMRREDIANYLGLAIETVSRLFSRFQGDGILAIEARDTRILDMNRLRALARLPELTPEEENADAAPFEARTAT